MTGARTVALVGAVGGAGTTRTAVELATVLARDGQEVAVLDAAFATQGLAGYLEGRLDPDLTALVTDAPDAPLGDGLVDLPLGSGVAGRVAVCPAHAPFERLARAKTAAAARAFEERLAEAVDAFDRVLVDVPPVAANQAVAAVTAAERVVLVAPADTRGADGVQRSRDRLADLGVEADAALSVRGPSEWADAAMPTFDAAEAVPACLQDDDVAGTVGHVAGVVVEAPLSLDLDASGVLDRLRDGVATRARRSG